MRKFRYNEQGDGGRNVVITVTEDEIIESYFPYWSGVLKNLGITDIINRETCIENFIQLHWAWEVKDEEPNPPS